MRGVYIYRQEEKKDGERDLTSLDWDSSDKCGWINGRLIKLDDGLRYLCIRVDGDKVLYYICYETKHDILTILDVCLRAPNEEAKLSRAMFKNKKFI